MKNFDKIYFLKTKRPTKNVLKEVKCKNLKPINVYIDDFYGGCESCFVQISSRRGIKVFPDKRSAKFSLKLQTRANKVNIGPRAYSEVLPILVKLPESVVKEWDAYGTNPELIDWNILWFYKTQVAPPDGDKYSKHFDKVITITNKFKKISKLKMDYPDAHDENIGFVGVRPMIIDFGEVSTDIWA